MNPTIGVTGVTGNLGAKVATRLADRGIAQRLVTRRPDAAPQLANAEVVAADYADADAVGKVTGRQFRYVDETLAEAYASRAPYGAPDWQVDAWVSTYLSIAAGEMAGLSDCVERIAGHRPISLRELLSRSS
jgi:nucleoside-diphosphate-sugar epimerase